METVDGGLAEDTMMGLRTAKRVWPKNGHRSLSEDPMMGLRTAKRVWPKNGHRSWPIPP